MTPSAGTILVVDDNADFLEQMKIALEAAGFRAVLADGRRAAEEALETARFDLAIVDLMMETPDAGLSLCYHIKKRDAATPVIVVTGVASDTGLSFDPATPEERAWFHADALLDKPVRFEQLAREIKRLLKREE